MKSDDETTVARNGNGTGTPLRAQPSGWCWVAWFGGERTFWEAQGPQVNSQNPHTWKKTHSTMLSSDLCVCALHTHTFVNVSLLDMWVGRKRPTREEEGNHRQVGGNKGRLEEGCVALRWGYLWSSCTFTKISDRMPWGLNSAGQECSTYMTGIVSLQPRPSLLWADIPLQFTDFPQIGR